MRDALGGLFNITLLFIFITLISGLILFGVNYYRAFKVKNKIITTIEQYEGNLNNPMLKSKINDYIKSIGYSTGVNMSRVQAEGYHCEDAGWCYLEEEVTVYDANGKNQTKKNCQVIYKVKTFVNGDTPFLNKSFFSFSQIFQVNGETKIIKLRGGSTCK